MISFDLTAEQQVIRDTVGAFASEQIRPAARPADEGAPIPDAVIDAAWQLGLVRGAIPERFGGYGDPRSAVTGAIVAEELAFGDLAIALHVLAPRLLAFPVLEAGAEAQQADLLARFGGDRFVAAAAAVIEPRWDFDLTAMETRARPDGADFILDGVKCCVPLAAEAAALLVYAAANGPDAGFAGVQGFVIPRATTGLGISAPEQNMGLKGLKTYEVTLSGCRVGAEARLGGDRGINFSRLMSESRVALTAMAVGVSRAAFEYARTYARERKAFGVPIATKQAVAFMLADMAIEIDAMRLLAWEAGWHLDRGEDALNESYLAKNYAAAAALKVTDNALQVMGGHGYIRDHPIEMWLRNARGFAAFEGLAIV